MGRCRPGPGRDGKAHAVAALAMVGSVATDELEQALRDSLADHGLADAGALSVEEIVAGLQAAIWHFTDGAALDRAAESDAVEKVYDFAIAEAAVGLPEPMSSDERTLSISPSELTGVAGTAIGPYLVSTTGGPVAIDARFGGVGDPLPVVDDEGNEVTSADDGDELFVVVDQDLAANEGVLTALMDTILLPGRVLVTPDNGPALIAVEAAVFSTASAGVAWTASGPTPTDEPTPTEAPTPPADQGGTLPDTGAGSAPLLAGTAVMLVAAGAGVLFVTRR